jgi:hypothetical protein
MLPQVTVTNMVSTLDLAHPYFVHMTLADDHKQQQTVGDA